MNSGQESIDDFDNTFRLLLAVTIMPIDTSSVHLAAQRPALAAWGGLRFGLGAEKNQSHEKGQKTRRVPQVGCTHC
jgi:hypothetical protein